MRSQDTVRERLPHVVDRPLSLVRCPQGQGSQCFYQKHVAYWADMGATSFKAYMQISRAQLGSAVKEAHKRGLKVTGHLCSVTFTEAVVLPGTIQGLSSCGTLA